MRLQTTNVVEQWRAEAAAERDDQERYQAHAAVEEDRAGTATAFAHEYHNTTRSIALRTFCADISGLLFGLDTAVSRFIF